MTEIIVKNVKTRKLRKLVSVQLRNAQRAVCSTTTKLYIVTLFWLYQLHSKIL